MSLGLMAPVLLAPATAFAVTPDEVLADAGLEARARSISKVLRCPVCQSEDIDESNAQVAHDLRMLVRERLVAGDSDQQVIDYIVARYGEYVLFDPPAKGANLILWYAGPGMAVVGALIALAFIRRRKLAAEAPLEALDAAEEKRLAEILRD